MTPAAIDDQTPSAGWRERASRPLTADELAAAAAWLDEHEAGWRASEWPLHPALARTVLALADGASEVEP